MMVSNNDSNSSRSSSNNNNNSNNSSILEHSIDIYENERRWIGGGFSKKGLLPNDRRAYSTIDGSASWKTLEEAQEALLLPGSVYLENSTFTLSEEEPLWNYTRDFSSGAIAHKTIKQGALHWVRFRRLVRPKRLDPKSLFPHHANTIQQVVSKCEHADSQAIQQLATTLVEVVAYLSLLSSPHQLTDAAMLEAKRKVYELLRDDSTLPYRTENNTSTSSSSSHARLEHLRKALVDLANKERNKPKHVLSRIDFFANRHQDVSFRERCRDLVAGHFPERSTLTGWLIRLLDDGIFDMHCNQTNCGNVCPFFHVSCPNEGCSLTLSQKHVPEHDQVCAFKLLPCPCGDSIRRRDVARHRQDVCPLRDTSCPFFKVGCPKVCQAHELPDHVETDVGGHLLLMLNRMMEQQNVIRDLNGKVISLQEENLQLKRTLTADREASEKESKNFQTKVTELVKKVSNLENASRKEFKRIRDHSRERAKQASREASNAKSNG
eukprot:scaffold7303_cov153-Amphora_coffeaeformis.AAC.10